MAAGDEKGAWLVVALLCGQSITESIERLEWFATEVTPLVDG